MPARAFFSGVREQSLHELGGVPPPPAATSAVPPALVTGDTPLRRRHAGCHQYTKQFGAGLQIARLSACSGEIRLEVGQLDPIR